MFNARSNAVAAALPLTCAVLLMLGGGRAAARPSAVVPLQHRGAATRSLSSLQPIKHVVFIIQENRSFDNLFQGYPGANTVSTGRDSKGHSIRLRSIPLEAPYDITHGSGDFMRAYDNGRMDGFDLEQTLGDTSKYAHPEYGYVPRAESRLYFAMAQQYVVADNAFTSNIDASYVSHLYAVAAQAHRAVNFPSYFGCDHDTGNVVATLTPQRQLGPSERTCQNYATLGDEADAAGLTWRYYTYATADWIWDPFASIKHVRYGPEWKSNVIAPETRVLDDIAAGSLANITWVTPSSANSDHSSSGSNTGPQWVASVVNAIGASPYWNSTAIFIMWDEWGGWYDHVAPPYVDYDGLGIRVPLLIISPYTKRNYVSHVQYETGSVLRFMENRLGLAALAASDARANDPAGDCFDFTRPPRRFHAFATGGAWRSHATDAAWRPDWE